MAPYSAERRYAEEDRSNQIDGQQGELTGSSRAGVWDACPS